MRKLIYFILLSFIVVFTACKTKYIEIPVHTKETEYKTKYERDSLYFKDSIYLEIRGDTVIKEKYIYRWRDRIKTDSVDIFIYQEKPVYIDRVEYTNKLKSWQKWLIIIAFISLIYHQRNSIVKLARFILKFFR